MNLDTSRKSPNNPRLRDCTRQRQVPLFSGRPAEWHFSRSWTNPLELCVMSHAGCYATIAALTAQKMRIQLKGCDVKVEAVKSEEAGTITEESFDILFNLDAPEDRVQRLHDVTLKNCPVGILFEKAGVRITYKLRTQKE